MVDDEEGFHDILEPYLTTEYRLLRAYNGWQALDALKRHHVDVVLLDLNLPDIKGMDLLGQMRRDRDDIEVIIITVHSEISNAVAAVKRGAFDFLAKTYENYQRLGDHVQRALLNRRRRREQIVAQTQRAWLGDAFATLEKSQSPQMQQVVNLTRKVSDTDLTVLLEGESGVGKEVLARYVHTCSRRASSPFVSAHLAAIPAQLLESHLFGHVKGAFTGADKEQIGKFELADGGTLFLDEIGELDGNAQVKLLRVLQEREVERIGAREPSPINVRVVAATNKNLQQEVKKGRFRADLYYRINVIRVQVPSLRQRKADLKSLLKLLCAKHAVQMAREVPHFTQDAMTVLGNYDWPGNVRELENLVMRLVALAPGKAIVADDIPPEYCLPTLNDMAKRAADLGARDDKQGNRLYFLAREQFERYLVRWMVNKQCGDKRAAAKALGVSYSTVKSKMRGDDPDWTVAIRHAGTEPVDDDDDE